MDLTVVSSKTTIVERINETSENHDDKAIIEEIKSEKADNNKEFVQVKLSEHLENIEDFGEGFEILNMKGEKHGIVSKKR